MPAPLARFKLLSTRSELAKAEALIRKEYAYRYGTAPSLPHLLFGAYNNKKLVGTIGLDFGNGSELPIERVQTFNKETTPLPFIHSQIAQYGRWVAHVPQISVGLAFVSTSYAMQHGKLYGLCELKEPIAKRLRGLGVMLHEVRDTAPILERIPKADLAYYSSESVPRVYMIRLEQMRHVMGEKALPLFEAGSLILDSSLTI